jgi:hypothetical protein
MAYLRENGSMIELLDSSDAVYQGFTKKGRVVTPEQFNPQAGTGGDDTQALQDALNFISNAKGGVLDLAAGVTYLISSSLVFSGTGPVVIRGGGMDANAGGITKIKASSTGTYTAIGTTGWNGILIFANASNINSFRFENFYVDMTGLTNTVGLYVDNVGYSYFKSIKFREGAIGLGAARVGGCLFDDIHCWNQAVYGFAFLYTDGVGGTGAGTFAVTTNGQGNSLRDCEYRMTSAVNNCTAGFAVLSGQQDIVFTSCHATRALAISTGLTHGFLIQGPVATWPPDATWAGQCHLINCNADAVADAVSGAGAGYTFKNYRHIRRTQCWDSAMDVAKGWYSAATIIDNCQDVVITGSELSSNGITLKNNCDLITLSSNHFLNAGSLTTCVSIGSATLTNLIFDVNNKKITTALWFDSQQLAAAAMNNSQQMDRNATGLITQAFNKLWLPTGAKGENFPRFTQLGNQAVLSSGRMSVVMLPLLGFEPISNLTFVSNATATIAPTNWWFALYDAARNLIRQSTDQLTTPWGANTAITLAIDSLPTTAGARAASSIVTLTIPTTLSTQAPLSADVAIGDSIVVSNANIAAYNGTFTVTNVTATQIQYDCGASATDSLSGPFPTVKLASAKRSFLPLQPANYYAALMMVAGTVPTITGSTSQIAVSGIVPAACGTADTGLTGTAPSPSASISAQGAVAYCNWS